MPLLWASGLQQFLAIGLLWGVMKAYSHTARLPRSSFTTVFFGVNWCGKILRSALVFFFWSNVRDQTSLAIARGRENWNSEEKNEDSSKWNMFWGP